MVDIVPEHRAKDRSKYAEHFAMLQAHPELDGLLVHVDTVRGGGLAWRLKEGRYVGLRGLTYDVEEHRTTDGRKDVCIRVTGREERT